MPFFTCVNLKKSYGSVKALNEANLSIEQGEVRAILGGNGSGKSTLSKIIGGSVKPDAGLVAISEQLLDIRSPKSAKQNGLIVTSQELSLLPNLSVEMNLVLSNIPKKGAFIDRVRMNQQAAEVLELVGLEHTSNSLVGDLPDNEKNLIEFAKAILQKPKVLIIDEITSALYRKEVERVKAIIHDLSANGTSILFISHRMSEIYSICSTVTVMRNGTTVSTHDLDKVTETELLVEMTGRTEQLQEVIIKEQNTHSSEVLLSVKDLKIPTFKSKIDLEVKKGEFVGICGLQGQGQSYLLQNIFGVNGLIELTLDNKLVSINNPRDAVQSGIAFLTGDRGKEGIFTGRSIAENLEVVNSGVFRNRMFNQGELLGSYKVKFNSIQQPIETLSGGNQQKVVIARWTGVQPKLLMADDPTKGIDVAARQDVHEIIHNLIMNGSSVIMVSSDDEELVRLSHLIPESRILVMYNGKFVKTLRGKEVNVSNIIAASIPRRDVLNEQTDNFV